MNQRVMTALVMAPLAISAVLWLPTPYLLPLVAVVFLLAAWEWGALIGLHSTSARAAVLLPPAALMAWLSHQSAHIDNLFPLVALIGCAWWLAALLWLLRPRLLAADTPVSRTLKLGILLLLIVPAWAGLALLHADEPVGPRWALFAIALVWAADTGAFYAGTRIGGRKLCPSISPGKTWAGFWGGLVTALLLACACFALLGLTLAQVPALLLLTLVTALASVLGDLFESVIKRQGGAKDSGHLIPGHGGVFDRVDSVVAALPVFAVGKIWLGL
jgi:phosphatidate cytidylyltransferase